MLRSSWVCFGRFGMLWHALACFGNLARALGSSDSWHQKQTIKVGGKITPINRGTVTEEVKFNAAYNHHWNFNFILNGERYIMLKDNYVANVYAADAKSTVTFDLRYVFNDIYLFIIMKSNIHKFMMKKYEA